MKPNRFRVRAASHRPLELSSRMKACCACTSRNCGPDVSPWVKVRQSHSQKMPHLRRKVYSGSSHVPRVAHEYLVSQISSAGLSMHGTYQLDDTHHQLCFIVTSQSTRLDLLQRVVAFPKCCGMDVRCKEADASSNSWIESGLRENASAPIKTSDKHLHEKPVLRIGIVHLRQSHILTR
jgi:hypothetical protein